MIGIFNYKIIVVELLDGTPANDWRTGLLFSHADTNASIVPWFMWLTSRYKLIDHYGNQLGPARDWELIDLQADPNELTNVYNNANYQAVIPHLTGQMYQQKAAVGYRGSITGGTQAGVTLK